MEVYFVYLLRSEKDGSTYAGMAKDVENRLSEHNRGKSRYTKSRIPFKLIYFEGPFPSEEARKREKYMKRSEVRARIIASH